MTKSCGSCHEDQYVGLAQGVHREAAGDNKNGKTPLELSRAFQVPKASMTHTLSGLAKAGYIEMLENERDKRSKLVHITDAGREFRDAAIQGLAPDIDAIAHDFGVEDVEAIVPALQRLREIMDKMRD